MKRILGILLAMLFFITPIFYVNAAPGVAPVIEVMKFNGEEYVATDTATSGDLILIRVSFNQPIVSLASLRVKVAFPTRSVSYMGGSFTPELVAGNVTAGNPVLNATEGTVTVFFGKGGLIAGDTDEFLGGSAATNIASFAFYCDGEAGETEFTATIDNALTADYKEVAMAAKSVAKKLNITKWQLSDEAKEAFEKLRDISYNPAGDATLPADSLEQIETAESIYNTYSASEKVQFATQYTELYELYRTARTRYFDKGLIAERAQIEAAAQIYRDTYQNAYNLDVNEVSLTNYKSVRAAIDAWETLDDNSPQVTLLLLNEKAKLDMLEPKVEQLEAMVQADADAKNWFIDRYANTLWICDANSVNDSNYGEFMEEVAAARADYDALDYDNLSDAVKKQVDVYDRLLQELDKKVAEMAEKSGEDAAIQKEIAAFTEKWYSVTRLTIMTAGVKDITAMELFLEDFAKLSDISQTRLANRKSSVEQLLSYVKNLNNITGNTGNTGNTGVNDVPQGGTTEIVKEVVKEIPVETVVEKLTNYSVLRNVPTIVYVSILLMGLAVLTLPIPLFLYRKYHKEKGETHEK